MALAENLEVTVGGDVNDGHLLLGGGLWRGPASAKNDSAESKDAVQQWKRKGTAEKGRCERGKKHAQNPSSTRSQKIGSNSAELNAQAGATPQWLVDASNHAATSAANLHLTLLLIGHQAPQLVDVDRRAVKLVQSLVEVTHTNFAEITRMAAIT